jgi:hypothetical protein
MNDYGNLDYRKWTMAATLRKALRVKKHYFLGHLKLTWSFMAFKLLSNIFNVGVKNDRNSIAINKWNTRTVNIKVETANVTIF